MLLRMVFDILKNLESIVVKYCKVETTLNIFKNLKTHSSLRKKNRCIFPSMHFYAFMGNIETNIQKYMKYPKYSSCNNIW